MHTDVVHGCREFLARYPWDAFATLTWRRPNRFEGIVKDVRGWLFAWAMLTAEGRGLARQDNRRGWSGWLPNQWRRGREKPVYVLGIEPPRSPEDVTGYVAKYVCKAGTELVMSDSFDAARLPGSAFAAGYPVACVIAAC